MAQYSDFQQFEEVIRCPTGNGTRPFMAEFLKRLLEDESGEILKHKRIREVILKVAETLDTNDVLQSTELLNAMVDRVNERDCHPTSPPNMVLEVFATVFETKKASEPIGPLVLVFTKLISHMKSSAKTANPYPWQYYAVLGMQRLLTNKHVNMLQMSAWSSPTNKDRVKLFMDLFLMLVNSAADVYLVDEHAKPIGDLNYAPFRSLWSMAMPYFAGAVQTTADGLRSLEPILIGYISMLQMMEPPKYRQLGFVSHCDSLEGIIDIYANKVNRPNSHWDKIIIPYMARRCTALRACTTTDFRRMEILREVTMNGPSRQIMNIRRGTVFDDSFKQRKFLKLEFTPVVRFYGESYNNPDKDLTEWYTLIGKEFVKSERKLLELVDPKKEVYRLGKGAVPEHLHFLGQVLARSFVDAKLIGVTLSDSVYKAILGEEGSDYADIKSEDAFMASKLQALADQFGMLDIKCSTRVEDQTKPLVKGFESIIPRGMIGNMLSSEDLKWILTKDRVFDVEDLISHLELGPPPIGFYQDTPLIQWLFEVLRSYSKEELGRFLNFVTGSPNLPALGFNKLWSPDMMCYDSISVVRDRCPGKLPESRPHLFSLYLSEDSGYTGPADLKKRLAVAIEYAARKTK